MCGDRPADHPGPNSAGLSPASRIGTWSTTSFATGRNWFAEAQRDARQHFESHVWWDMVREVVLVLLLLAPSLATAWRHLMPGIELLGIEIVLILLWYLLVVTPARMHRDSLAELAEAEKEEVARTADLARCPNLSVEIRHHPPNEISLSIANSGGAVSRLFAHIKILEPDARPPGASYLKGAYGIELLKGGSTEIPLAYRTAYGTNHSIWLFHLRDHERDRPWNVDFSANSFPPTTDQQEVIMEISVVCEAGKSSGTYCMAPYFSEWWI